MQDNEENKVDDPIPEYGGKTIRIFESFEDQNNYEREQMAKLTPIELLQNLRRYINIAYGMHGFDPENLPVKHTLTFYKNNKQIE